MKKYKYTNRLIDETSPYLYSHAHQPINWYSWCDEALEKARNENKLLFISIGYSACHWCHVMASECFENETIAQILNEHYISIKIDKEERPDLDQIYLNAVQMMTDNAGWPLNCFALSDGTPVFGGTYFTSTQFVDIIQSLQDTYLNQFDKVKEVADDLRDALKNIDVITERVFVQKFLENDIRLIIEPWKRKFDNINGGTQNPPKFPLPNGKEFLMWTAYYFEDEEIKQHLSITLNKMANGAIYDQIAGGFFRYTIDAEWKIPHFEKMLYDNVQLVSLYAQAYRFFKNQYYKKIAEDTLAFMLREMHSPDGAFYCSIDSDSNGSEGKYYMWSMNDFNNVLQDDAKLAADYFGINQEQDKVLEYSTIYVAINEADLAVKYGLTLECVKQKIEDSKQKLLEARIKRQTPLIDKKIIASWNGMALTSLLNAYIAFNNEEYLLLAKQTAQYIKSQLIHDKQYIYRSITSKYPIKGFLDDYAFVSKAFILLSQITGDKQYIEDAKTLTDTVIGHFYDKNSGMFYFTSNEEEFVLGRKMDFIDRAVPSSCSEIAQNLILLAFIYNNVQYYNCAQQMLSNIKSQMPGAGPFISNWGKLLFYYIYDPILVKMPDNIDTTKIKSLWESYLPNIVICPNINLDSNDTFTSTFSNYNLEQEGDELLEDRVEVLKEMALKGKRKDRCVVNK